MLTDASSPSFLRLDNRRSPPPLSVAPPRPVKRPPLNHPALHRRGWCVCVCVCLLGSPPTSQIIHPPFPRPFPPAIAPPQVFTIRHIPRNPDPNPQTGPPEQPEQCHASNDHPGDQTSLLRRGPGVPSFASGTCVCVGVSIGGGRIGRHDDIFICGSRGGGFEKGCRDIG